MAAVSLLHRDTETAARPGTGRSAEGAGMAVDLCVPPTGQCRGRERGREGRGKGHSTGRRHTPTKGRLLNDRTSRVCTGRQDK